MDNERIPGMNNVGENNNFQDPQAGNSYSGYNGYDQNQYAGNGYNGYDQNQYAGNGYNGYDQNQYAGNGVSGYDQNQYAGNGYNGYDQNQYVGNAGYNQDGSRRIDASEYGIQNPVPGTQSPYASDQNPYAGGQNPYAGGQNPYAGGQNPYAGSQNPYAGGQNQYAGGQNPYAGGQNPYAGGQNQYTGGGQNPYTDAKAPVEDSSKGKKGKKKIAIIAGISAAVIALAICAVIFIPKLFKPKKEDIQKFITNTGKKVLAANELGDVIGGDNLCKVLAETGGRIRVKYTESKSSIDATLDYDVNSNSASSTVDIEHRGEKKSLQGFLKDGRFSATISPDMSGYYYVDIKNAMNEAMQSYIASIAGESAEAYSAYLAGISGASTDKVTEIYKKLIDSIEYSKDGTEKITLGSNTVKATKYVVTIPKEKLQEAISDAVDVAMESMANDMSGQANYIGLIKSYINSLISKDIVVNLYEYKDGIVAADFIYDINFMGQGIKFSVNLSFVGNDDPYSSLEGSVMFEMDQNKAEIYFGYDSHKTSNGAETSFNVKFINNGTSQDAMLFVVSYDESAQEVLVKSFFDNGIGGVRGKVLTNDHGNTFEVQFDKVFEVYPASSVDSFKTFKDVEASADSNIKDIDLFVGLYTDSSVKSPDGSAKLVNFFTASEEEFKSILSPELIEAIEKYKSRGGYDYDH